MSKIIKKIVSTDDGTRIINLYKKFSTHYFPKLISHRDLGVGIELDFEWINGNVLSPDKIESAFVELGKMHKSNIINKLSNGFTTFCHGDFHINNIISTTDGIRFIDTTYIKEGWNYSDLDYVDFFDLYDQTKYPWMIKNANVLQAYNEGLEIKMDTHTEEQVKLKITIYSLEYTIQNSIKNNIECSWEMQILEEIKKKLIELD